MTPAFIKQFGREVHEAYMRLGSKLRQTVRTKTGVTGPTAVFQRIGSIAKAEYSPCEAALMEYYAGEWVDALDKLKANIDEREVLANAAAFALGRKSDELIVNALSHTTNIVCGDYGMVDDKISAAFEMISAPDDGQRYVVVGWKQWSELLNTASFGNAKYAGEDELPWRGSQAKKWLGALWLPHSGLPCRGNIRTCFLYHKSAIGHACGQDVTTDVTWHDDRSAHFVCSSIAQGAVLIDPDAVVKIYCKELS